MALQVHLSALVCAAGVGRQRMYARRLLVVCEQLGAVNDAQPDQHRAVPVWRCRETGFAVVGCADSRCEGEENEEANLCGGMSRQQTWFAIFIPAVLGSAPECHAASRRCQVTSVVMLIECYMDAYISARRRACVIAGIPRMESVQRHAIHSAGISMEGTSMLCSSSPRDRWRGGWGESLHAFIIKGS